MTTVGVYEAKTQLPKLLDRVAQGERVTITRHGKPIAVLVPAATQAPRVNEVIESLRAFRKGSQEAIFSRARSPRAGRPRRPTRC